MMQWRPLQEAQLLQHAQKTEGGRTTACRQTEENKQEIQRSQGVNQSFKAVMQDNNNSLYFPNNESVGLKGHISTKTIQPKSI